MDGQGLRLVSTIREEAGQCPGPEVVLFTGQTGFRFLKKKK